MTFYKLFDSEMPVGTMVPADLLVIPFKLVASSRRLWSPVQKSHPAEQGQHIGDDLGTEPNDADEDEEADFEAEEEDGDLVALPDPGMLAAELEDALAALLDEPDVLNPEEIPSVGLGAPVAPAVLEAGQGSAAPSPPSHNVDVAAPKRGRGRPAEVTFMFGCGTISYYSNTGDFVATCMYDGHGSRCRLTRRANPTRLTTPGSGRALGLMASFLSNEIHTCEEGMFFTSLFSQREAARAKLAQAPGSEVLCLKERLRRPGEGEEPEDCP